MPSRPLRLLSSSPLLGRVVTAAVAVALIFGDGALPTTQRDDATAVRWPAPAVRVAPAVSPPTPRVRPTRASRAGRRSPSPATCLDAAPGVRGAAALATLRPAWRRSGVVPTFSGPRRGLLGETQRRGGAVSVFVRPCAQEPTALLRHVVAHELGHAWDLRRLTPAQRLGYKRARGIPVGTPWFGCSGCADFATPAGDFAEMYSLWLRQGAGSRSEMAPPPTPAQLAELARRFFGG